MLKSDHPLKDGILFKMQLNIAPKIKLADYMATRRHCNLAAPH